MRPRLPFFAAAAAVAVSCAALAAWGAAGWPGNPNLCLAADACFCEAFGTGWVRQPANTWSNLGFIAVGLALSLRARSPRAALFAALIALLGPGSMALHASMTHWGGVFDVASMLFFITFALAQDAERLAEVPFAAVFWPVSAALTAAEILAPAKAIPIFAAAVAAYAAAEAAVWLRGKAPSRDPRRLGAAAAFFLAAFALWAPSQHGTGALCSPAALWQPHAGWHLLCALAAGAVYLYLEPELEYVRIELRIGD